MLKKSVFCPHCKRSIGERYSVNLSIGVVCLECDKVIFPVSEENQPKLEKPKVPVTTTGYYQGHQHPYSHQYSQYDL